MRLTRKMSLWQIAWREAAHVKKLGVIEYVTITINCYYRIVKISLQINNLFLNRLVNQAAEVAVVNVVAMPLTLEEVDNVTKTWLIIKLEIEK